jgi:hypothetical protein
VCPSRISGPDIVGHAFLCSYVDFRIRLHLGDSERGRDLPNLCEDDSLVDLVGDSSGLFGGRRGGEGMNVRFR